MDNLSVLSFARHTDATWAWQTYDDLARQTGYCVGYPDLEAAMEGALNHLMGESLKATQPPTPEAPPRRKRKH